MEYRASLDNTAKLITVVCFLLLGFLVYQDASRTAIPALLKVILTFAFFIAFLLGYLYAPNKYLIRNGVLTIARPAGSIHIPVASILEARVISQTELGTLIRLWGSSGLFGYYGYFRSTRIGRVRLYTTRRDNRILITTTDDNRLLISPNDLSMIGALKA